MLPTIAVYAALSIQSYLHFLGKSHFESINIYHKLIAYIARTNNPRDIFNHIESTSHRLKKSKITIEANHEKIRPFPKGSAELDLFKFIWIV